MNIPSELLYSKEHEWVLVDGNLATIGISDYAQQELGDVVYVELPEEGQEYGSGESFGSVESVKAVSEIYMPVSGTIREVNQDLADTPERVNEDPYGDGWMVKVRIKDRSQLDDLMGSDEYQSFLEEETQ